MHAPGLRTKQRRNPLRLLLPAALALTTLLAVCTLAVPCNETHRFQYQCEDDADDMPGMRACPVSEHTTYVINSTRTMPVTCRVYDGVNCEGPRTFTVERPCLLTNGVALEVALCLSALAGCFGFDRCYLGYPTLGFLKFTTCGGFLIWWVLDVVLIAAQVLEPADGSSYVITSVPRLYRHVPQNHSIFD